MEKFSNWRDNGTGVAPFVEALAPTTTNLPFIAKVIVYPFAYLLASIRTILLLLLLIIHFTLVEMLLKACLVIPPFYNLLSRTITTVLMRLSLLILGYVWINVENITLKRTVRGPVAPPFSPGKGDLIISNCSSYVEILYLAFRFNATFLLPCSSTGSKASATSAAKITSFRRVSVLKMICNTGFGPERSEAGESLELACKNSRGPVVLFPECTTSNNRALLKFGQLQYESNQSTGSIKTFIISFKYDLPTSTNPSATQPIPSSSYNPIPHLFNLTTSPFPRSLTVKKLNPLESPKLSAIPKSIEWESLAESLAVTGRWKKTGLDWEMKEEFLKFRAKKR